MRQNFSGRGGSSPNSQQQGDASQWGPLQEGVNSFMFGAGPAVNEWLGKNAPTWMLSGAQPTTASQEQANRDAYAAQNPGTTTWSGEVPSLMRPPEIGSIQQSLQPAPRICGVRLAYASLRRWSLNPTSLEDVARHLGVSPEEMAQYEEKDPRRENSI